MFSGKCSKNLSFPYWLALTHCGLVTPSRSTLAQVMGCCLMVPTHYLNQCWLITVLLKYGRPVAKCDPWVHRATQGPTIDGPFGDQWILQVLQKMFWNESGETIPQMHGYQMSIVPYQNGDPVWSILTIFDWLHGLSRLSIDGLPRTETDHPTINHR